MKTITYDKERLQCNGEISELKVISSLEGSINILVKENKKTVSYSLNRIEEVALYEFLKSRNKSLT
jgi:hypothetical protein